MRPLPLPLSSTLLLLLAGLAATQLTSGPRGARPQVLGINTTCPEVMVLAARETTAPPGFGSAKTLASLIVQAYPGAAAAQSIEYPAAGGNNTRMPL